ncbi:MAG: 50S ribosomal protein L24 [Oscillospiraceae bacterium]|nr:50S ribosomal protein L24 [Oscillospiraceae bacterium]
MNNLHVKKGDTVVLLTGKYKDKFSKPGVRRKGKVVGVSPKEGKVIVEGVNKVKKHVKPRQAGQPGGIIDAEAPIYACKVQVVCPKCDKPTRVGHSFKEVKGETTKVRICKKCGAVL